MRGLGIFLALWPGIGLADGWGAFEARCLTPMETVRAPLTGGLRHESTTRASDGMGIASYLGEGFAFEVVTRADGTVMACGVRGDRALADAFEGWAKAAVQSGRYDRRDEADTVAALRSHEIREPVVFVTLRRWPVFWSATVRETDLES